MIGYANQIDNFQTSGESGTREALNFTEENMDKNEKWLQWAVLFFFAFWKKIDKKTIDILLLGRQALSVLSAFHQ